jgi:hypothetical protein
MLDLNGITAETAWMNANAAVGVVMLNLGTELRIINKNKFRNS